MPLRHMPLFGLLVFRVPNGDHTDCDSWASVTGGLTRQIVHSCVDDKTATEDIAQVCVAGGHIDHRDPVLVGGDIAEVACMTHRPRRAVIMSTRIEVAARRRAIGGAAISEFVYMESVFAWRQFDDLADDLQRIALLNQSQHPADFVAFGWHQLDHAEGCRVLVMIVAVGGAEGR